MVALSPILALPAPLALGITPLAANSLAFAFTSAYVGSVYLAPYIFPVAASDKNEYPPPGHRDHPGTMKSRMKAVSIATRLCLACVGGVVYTIGGYKVSRDTFWETGKEVWIRTARLLGLSTFALDKPIAYALGPVLFLGPLYGFYLDGTLPGQRNFGPLQFGLPEERNYLVGPLSEELLFRSAIIAVSILGGFSWKYLVFASPLWFGLAHIHHGVQVYRDGGRTGRALKMAIMSAVFQTGYTTLFGWIASYIFIRTGSVTPAFITHTFCNMMGLPMIGPTLQQHPKKKLSIWASYLLGIAGFGYLVTKL